MDPFDKPSAWRGLESAYRNYLQEVEPIRLIVELGVDYGFSLFTLARDYPESHVIGIDSYNDLQNHTDALPWVAQHISKFPNACVIRAWGREVSERTRAGEGPEAFAGRVLGTLKALPGEIDLLHIDTVHDYESTREEFELFEPLVRPGGCIMFHDVDSFPDGTGRFFLHLDGRKSVTRHNNPHGLGFWFKGSI